MNPYAVFLYSDGLGACWVEVMNACQQEGPDMDCATRRQGLFLARRECKRLGLASFSECRTHHIANSAICRNEGVQYTMHPKMARKLTDYRRRQTRRATA